MSPAWLLLRYFIKPFLSMLICQNLFMFEVAVLKCIFWESIFEVHPCSEKLKVFFNIRLQFDYTLFQTYFLLKLRKQKYSQFFVFLVLYLHCTITIRYFYNFTFSVLNKTFNTVSVIVQSLYYKKRFLVSFNQNWFHKRYSKLIHKCYSK